MSKLSIQPNVTEALAVSEISGLKFRRSALGKRLIAHLARTAQNLEDSGNPAAAEAFRRRWSLLPTDVPKPKPVRKRKARAAVEDVEPKREPTSKGWKKR